MPFHLARSTLGSSGWKSSVDRSLNLGQYWLSRLADAQQEQHAAERVTSRASTMLQIYCWLAFD